MRHVTRWLCTGLLLAAAPLAGAAEWSGHLGAVAAARFSDGHATILGIEARLKFADDFGAAAAPWSLRLDGRLRTNDRVCSRPAGPQGCDEARWHADWRELYVARQWADWRAALGWQQAVWGRADNLRVLDLVNPLDLRDFVLPDLNDTRRSQPMLKLNGTLADWSVEAVVLPRFAPNRTAGRGAEFYFGEAEQFAAQGVTLLPRQGSQHGEVGLLLSHSMHQVDLSLAALSVFNDDPVYRLAVADLGNGPTLTATPEHLRHAVLGASLAMPLAGGWVLRGETSWSPDTPYSATTAPQGIERSRTLTALVGIDYAWRDWLFTAQATDRRIADWRPDYLVPQRAAAVTLSATGTTLQARLTTRLAVTWMPQNGDGSLWQARFTYRPDDHWAIETSIDVLEGKPGGFFGQFRDRDRVRVELRRQF